MAGIYIHIPFCKQACHYCDFHFSTSLKKKGSLVKALGKELELRKDELSQTIETIYFGGGTPSLLSEEELAYIFNVVYKNYTVSKTAEITLEANPDDLSRGKIKELAQSKINRLSIGVQSFFEDDLRWMNRSHNAKQALSTIEHGKAYFDNISIDLIYGVPGMTDKKWKKNLDKTLAFAIPHVSSYALTVEPKTALKKMIELGKKEPVDDASAQRHYQLLVKTLTEAGYVNYEFSNFGRSGYFSQNNTAYWMGKPYLGIGPSAHGFDGTQRSWNIRNNTLYIKALEQEKLPIEKETLSVTERYNEYVMTRLRTIWGVSYQEIVQKFGENYLAHFKKEAKRFYKEGLLKIKNKDVVHITKKGKFLGDGISAELFYVD